jgi:hypothetical protein
MVVRQHLKIKANIVAWLPVEANDLLTASGAVDVGYGCRWVIPYQEMSLAYQIFLAGFSIAVHLELPVGCNGQSSRGSP